MPERPVEVVGAVPHGLAVAVDLMPVCRAAQDALGVESVLLTLVAEQADVLVVGAVTPEAETLAARAIRHRTPEARADAAGSALAVPLVGSDGEPLGALCVAESGHRPWGDHERDLLTVLARWAATEMELGRALAHVESDRLAWRLSVDAAGVGAFEWDLATGELRWDERLMELFGYDEHTFGGTIQAFDERVHPEDLPRVTEALRTAIETTGEYVAEYRVVLPDGTLRWIGARGRALAEHPGGPTVRVLGAAYDTTAVQEGEARVARVLESMPTAFFQVDTGWRFTYANSEAERLLGMTRTQMVGGSIWDLFPAAIDSDFERFYRHAAESGEPVAFDAYYPPPLDAWYEVRAWPSPDGLAVYFIDVTARHAAQEELDAAARRGEVLARVTETLTGTLDATEAVSRLATLLVPSLADWCLVTLVHDVHVVDWRQGLRDVGWQHVDEEQAETLHRYAALRLSAMLDSSYLAQALSSTSPIFVATEAAEHVADVLGPGEAQELVRALAPESMVVVPLRGRDRTVGVVSVFRGAGREAFSADERALLADVGSRAGLALDNARLYAEQREVAAALQRSLLTQPPQLEHLQIAVRYLPAREAAQVGGDWYDAFLQPSGDGPPEPVVVVGDVVGHDLAAAASMGQVRGLLRGIAAHSGAAPAAVISGVDAALDTLRLDTTATAVVARLEHIAGSEALMVRWSNAGHPPPLLATADGEVSVLLAPGGNDLLLGLDPATHRTEHRVRLEPGATLLLYTDGLVERRGQAIDLGIKELATHIADLAAAGIPLEEVCDLLLGDMVPAQGEDDVALIAVRIAG